MSPVVLRPDRTFLAVVVVMAVAALPLALSSPWLLPLLLLPFLTLVWVLRARVASDGAQLVVCNGLGSTNVAWPAVQGFQVPPKGSVRLLREGHKPLRMSAVTRRELPRLLEAAPAPGDA